MAKRVAILQSNYIPWKGYFDLIGSVDEFFIYDEVQYTRRDWRNRNKIKTDKGVEWLTIPVDAKGKYFQKIRETNVVDQSWAVTHWLKIRQHYAKTEYFDEYAPIFERLYRQEAAKLSYLSEINLLFMKAINQLLGIQTKLFYSDECPRESSEKSDRLMEICLHAGAGVYLSGPAAKGYLDESLFASKGMQVEWMSYDGYCEYPQMYGEFRHDVTVLDLIFNTGNAAREFLINSQLLKTKHGASQS